MNKNITIQTLAWWAVVVLLAVCACSDETEPGLAGTGDGRLAFSPDIVHGWHGYTRGAGRDGRPIAMRTAAGRHRLYVARESLPGINSQRLATPAATRGVPRTADNFYQQLGILMYCYRDDDYTAHTPNYIYNEPARSRDGVYATDRAHYWPAADYRVWMYAYAPFDGEGIALSGSEVAGPPVLSYSVPADVRRQHDVMTAEAMTDVTDSRPQSIPLAFHHLLAAVQFKIGDNMSDGTIDRIVLKGVLSQGDFRFGSGWDNCRTPADFAVETDFPVRGFRNITVTEGDSTLMMLPQTLPADAAIAVTFTDGEGQQAVYEAPIGGQTWSQGYTYIYSLQLDADQGEYHFTCSADFAAGKGFYADCEGGDGQYRVYSYKVGRNGTHANVRWRVTGYSTDYGTAETPTWTLTAPSWFTVTREDDGGEADPDVLCDVHIDEQLTVKNACYQQQRAAMQAAEALGSTAAYYDLSLHHIDGTDNGGETTANCYVVRRPGYYKLPLVYGNARKDGADNTEAYTGTPYCDYLDQPITSPYIYTNTTVDGVELLWQTREGLISTTDLTTDGQYIYFHVPADKMAPGNALIAAKHGADIVWSWHLWVTDAPVWQTVAVSHQGPGGSVWGSGEVVTTNVCHYNLGATYQEDIYETRHCFVRMTQEGSGKEIIVYVRQQTDNEAAYEENYTYYQWGRKDPFMPEVIAWNAETLNYTRNDVSDTRDMRTIGQCIQHPTTFYCTDSWGGGYLKSDVHGNWPNLWNIDGSYHGQDYQGGPAYEAPTRKTVYDPCPPGFCVGSVYAYMATEALGNKWADDFDEERWGRHIVKTDGSADIFFPCPSIFDGDIPFDARYKQVLSGYWTSTASSYHRDEMPNQHYAFWINFTNTYNAQTTDNPHDSYGQMLGMAIRPVLEDDGTGSYINFGGITVEQRTDAEGNTILPLGKQ